MAVFIDKGKPMLASNGGQIPSLPEILEWGHQLATTSMGIQRKDASGKMLWEAKGWKEFVESMPDEKKASAAIFLENCRAKFGRLDEVTRTQNLGTFDKWIFPVIANMTENDVIDQLVAVQPMAGPNSQIVYMDIVTGRRKGRTPAGAPMWRAQQGAVDRDDDGDERITGEDGNLSGNGAVLEWFPLRAGTITITVGNDTTSDNGNGAFAAVGSISGGTVNYQTGAFTISGVSATAAYSASYVYVSEANSNIQEYELKLSNTPVTAKVVKLKTSWTEEADQNLTAMFNIKMESTVLNALTGALQYQKHRQVIHDLRARADAGVVEWDAEPPTNGNYQNHKFTLVDTLETASMLIFSATNQVCGNWVLTGVQAATVLRTLPHFVPKNNSTQMNGVTFIGTVGDKKIFVDPHFPVNEFLIGHKGDQFFSTGYVLAEYQKLYTTPDVVLTDFVHQRGFATSFARKMINNKFYARGVVKNAPTKFGTVIG